MNTIEDPSPISNENGRPKISRKMKPTTAKGI
eukprot:COSAG06_NODE_62889_length_263_cov_22.250000_1_plen_31_part_10